jgi:hypothetical protein
MRCGNIISWFACLVVFCGVGPDPAAAAAGAAGPRIDNIAIGFQGAFKVGYWTPLWITLSAGPAAQSVSLEILTPDTDGVQTRFDDAEPVALAASQQVTVVRYFKPGQVAGELVVQMKAAGRLVAARRLTAGQFPRALAADHALVVTYGPAVDVSPRAVSENHEPHVSRPGELPDRWIGYDGVDVLVLSTSDQESIDALSDQQVDAIRQWVRMGGRLIFCVGGRGADVLGDGSRWADFAPGRFVGVLPVRSVSALETYSGSGEPLVATGALQRPMRMTRLTDVIGKVELSDTAADGLRPIIVRSACGLGLVAFVAFDLDVPPLAGWEGTPRILAKVRERLLHTEPHQAADESPGRMAHEGYEDLTGQLRNALDEFSGVALVRFSWVACLGLLYIALIGPGDYLLLHRALRRMQWTWVTFPIIVVAFTGLAVALNYQFKNREFRMNQVDVVDIDAMTKVVRGTTWSHAYSPTTAAYDLRAEPSWPEGVVQRGGALLAWQGLPGSGLGGMSGQARAASFSSTYTIPVRQSSVAEVQQVPISVASTKSMLVRWWGTAAWKTDPQLHATADGLLAGQVTNPLPYDLTESMVLFENWAYRLDSTDGRLRPGQSVQIEGEHPFNLEWRLMRRRVKDTNDVRTPWDPASKDVPRILEMMMFHGAAGASGYTHLSHRYQGFVDLSDHLTAGCAVLVGRCAQPAVEFLVNGQQRHDTTDQHWTFVRIVMPVRAWSHTRSPAGI